MKKLVVLLMVLCGFVSQANAGVLGNFLSNGQNILEDGSREFFVKGAGNVGPGIESGDMLIGFSKIVNILPANNFVANSVYAVFSQTFDVISADLLPGPGQMLRTFSFRPTTEAGFTLADLLGTLDPGGLAPESMIALVSHTSNAFSKNLETDSVGANIFSHFNLLASEGDLDAVFGLFNNGSDFFGGQTGVGLTNAMDYVANLANLANVLPQNRNLANFEGSLSLVYDKPGLPLITSGALVVGGTVRLPGAGENVDGAFTFVNDADLILSAVIPEPTSLSVFGLMGLALCSVRRRRA